MWSSNNFFEISTFKSKKICVKTNIFTGRPIFTSVIHLFDAVSNHGKTSKVVYCMYYKRTQFIYYGTV